MSLTSKLSKRKNCSYFSGNSTHITLSLIRLQTGLYVSNLWMQIQDIFQRERYKSIMYQRSFFWDKWYSFFTDFLKQKLVRYFVTINALLHFVANTRWSYFCNVDTIQEIKCKVPIALVFKRSATTSTCNLVKVIVDFFTLV